MRIPHYCSTKHYYQHTKNALKMYTLTDLNMHAINCQIKPEMLDGGLVKLDDDTILTNPHEHFTLYSWYIPTYVQHC